MSRLLVLLAVLLAACGGYQGKREVEVSPAYALETELNRATIANVNLDAGVSYNESLAIAKYYLLKIQGRLGSVAEVTDRGRSWEVQIYSGAMNLESRTISIDKKSGRVSSFGWPTVENLQKLLAD